MKLSHRKVQAYLQADADGRLAESQRIALDRHLAGCPDCQTYAANLTRLESYLTQALHARQPLPRASEREMRKIILAIEAQRTKPMHTRPSHSVRPLVWGTAIVMLALVIGLSVKVLFSKPIVVATTPTPLGTDESRQPTSTPLQSPPAPTRPSLAAFIPGNDPSYRPAMSADGSIIAFESSASNLIAGNAFHTPKIIVQDRKTDVMVQFSPEPDSLYMHYGFTSLSADGRYLALEAWKVVDGEDMAHGDIFVLDRQTGEYQPIAPPQDDPRLTGINFTGHSPAISADGRWVVFWAADVSVWGADSLPSQCQGEDGLDRCSYLFFHDRQTSAAEWIELPSYRAFAPTVAMSDDGRYLALALGNWEENPDSWVYVYDRETQALELVSLAVDGAQANGRSHSPDISADGRYVAFYSEADNLVAGDNNGVADIFVRDRQTETTTRVSVSSDGAQANGKSYNSLAISADGNWVAFWSFATNLSPDVSAECVGVDSEGMVCPVLYLHDLRTGNTEVVYEGGVQPNLENKDEWIVSEMVYWFDPAISQHGRLIAFTGYSDKPQISQVYLYDAQTGVTEMVSAVIQPIPESGATPTPAPLAIAALGETVNLTNSPESDAIPAWSPDGSRLAFVADAMGKTVLSGEIRLVNSDGSGLITLAGNPSMEEMPTWSPDGARIAFLSDRSGKNEIYVVNADDTGLLQLTEAESVPMGFLYWSPDGTRIAALFYEGDQCDLYAVNADGSGMTRLTESPVDFAIPRWSADGSQIAVVYDDSGAVAIAVLAADGSGKQVLGSLPASAQEIYWSPDGSRIAYVIPPAESGAPEPAELPGLYVANADGSHPIRLTEMDALSPHWSPDGQRIAFVSDDEHSRIYLINADGSGLSVLTDDVFDGQFWPAWSPDGTCLAFMARLSMRDDLDIYVVKVAEGRGR